MHLPIPDPAPGPKDVVIKVDACGVCFHDIVTRNGTLKFGVQMPCILGHEISGTVVEQYDRPNIRVATQYQIWMAIAVDVEHD